MPEAPQPLLPRLLFLFDFPPRALLIFAAVPPPRLRLVPLGFFPERRFSPGRAPESRGPGSLFFSCDFFGATILRYFFLPPNFFPPFLPPFRAGALLLFLPRPDPLFFPPLSDLLTVAQARFSASFFETPRFS